jgi:hypothetical protein
VKHSNHLTWVLDVAKGLSRTVIDSIQYMVSRNWRGTVESVLDSRAVIPLSPWPVELQVEDRCEQQSIGCFTALTLSCS